MLVCLWFWCYVGFDFCSNAVELGWLYTDRFYFGWFDIYWLACFIVFSGAYLLIIVILYFLIACWVTIRWDCLIVMFRRNLWCLYLTFYCLIGYVCYCLFIALGFMLRFDRLCFGACWFCVWRIYYCYLLWCSFCLTLWGCFDYVRVFDCRFKIVLIGLVDYVSLFRIFFGGFGVFVLCLFRVLLLVWFWLVCLFLMLVVVFCLLYVIVCVIVIFCVALLLEACLII